MSPDAVHITCLCHVYLVLARDMIASDGCSMI